MGALPRILVVILLCCFATQVGAQSAGLDFLTVPPDPGYREVQFVEGSIFDIDWSTNVISLLEGTEWLGAGMFVLTATDIIILPVPSEDYCVAYSGGMTDVLRLVNGSPILQSGYLVNVTKKSSGGDVLKLSTGDVLELGYDSFRAHSWFAPFTAIVTTTKIYNLDRGESIHATFF